MFPKKNRADKSTVDKVFKNGSFFGGKTISFRYLIEKRADFSPKISVIVPKSIEKRAIHRNELRRNGYLMLKEFYKLFPVGFLGTMLINKAKFRKEELEYDLSLFFNRLKSKK